MIYLTRRAFIKAGAVGAAGLTILGNLEKYLHALEKDGNMYSFQREILPFIAIPSICHQCPAGCGLLGLAVDDELVGVLGNPGYPANKGGICTKAAAMMNLVYDQDRVATPLKRMSYRGENKWERISWGQALKEIAAVFSKSERKNNVAQIGVDEGYTPAIENLGRIGNFSIINEPANENISAVRGHEIFWGSGEGIPDVAKSRYILNFGSNPYENHNHYIPFVQRLVKGRVDNKARLVTFDVRLSNTAGKSDEWFPVRPGTDVSVILAMCNHIMNSGLADTAFINRWSATSVKKLIDYLSRYTPEAAESESGVKADDIRRIAVDFATQKPAVAFCGSGITHNDNGTNNQLALLMLNAITGNIDREGGYCLPRKNNLKEPRVKSLTGSIDSIVEKENNPVGVYITYISNPVFSGTDGGNIELLLKDRNKIGYYIAIDTHITETSKYADIILPAATTLESWGLDSRASVDMIPYWGLRQPVIKPVMEAKSFAAITELIGKEMGIKAVTGEETYIEEGLKTNGLSPDLMKKAGFHSEPESGPSYGKKRLSKLVLTKSAGTSTLPYYKSVDKANPAKGMLYLTVFTKSVSTEQNPNSKWLSEINHENPLWINSKTAEKLGIQTGDSVDVISKGIKLNVSARVTEMVHPEVAAIAEGLGHWEYGNFAKGLKAETKDDDTSLIWWGGKNGNHVSRLVKEGIDPVSGGSGVSNTIVTIKKVG